MRTLIASVLVSFALLTGFELASPMDARADCVHYFQREVHQGQLYLVEYTCDGVIVNMMPISD